MAGCYPPPAVPIISTSSKPSQDTGSGYCTFFSSAVQRSSGLDRAPPCRNACAKERAQQVSGSQGSTLSDVSSELYFTANLTTLRGVLIVPDPLWSPLRALEPSKIKSAC
ncbi:predicted protein [Histoplasma capsulatum var. duboisii H88]|uniref:Predicted protein n=2 Tax=Ajellomyces capsulatus TaxID=5037 RepID=F0UK92_AJEC8|nr:predicted protein [Histoplasma capsulatum H143]EGC45879.1 predicted protein [Histoplasma capsulatum var. duboisii H88]